MPTAHRERERERERRERADGMRLLRRRLPGTATTLSHHLLRWCMRVAALLWMGGRVGGSYASRPNARLVVHRLRGGCQQHARGGG